MANFIKELFKKRDKNGNPYTKIDDKYYLINPTKGKTPVTILSTPDSHPAHTRYPFLNQQPTSAVYTSWKEWFAWHPVKMINNKWVVFKNIYKRERTLQWVPESYTDRSLKTSQYFTWEGILELKMRNE